MARKKAKGGIYLVQRMSWTVWDDDGRGQCTRHEEDQGVPVRAFRSEAAAQAYCAELEAEARRELNPFQFHHGEIGLLTADEDEDRFLEGVARLGLEAPTSERYHNENNPDYVDYAVWWDAVQATLTPEQREGVWSLLDDLCLYVVVETTLE